MGNYIGLDIGGTNMVFGLLDEEGNMLRTLKTDTEVAQGSAYVLDKIASKVRQLFDESDVPLTELKAIGIGMPGFLDPESGLVKLTANLPFTKVNVAEELQRRLDVPVFINNDVKMYVYGEAMKGAGEGYVHVMGLTLGTGMSAAVVNNGSLYYGSGFNSGEIGHVKIDGVPYACGCGMSGCLETIASATGIARQAMDALNAGRESVLNEWLPGEMRRTIRAADVSKAYDVGDTLAKEIYEYTGTMLGKSLAHACTMASPDVIVIGGGVSLAGERILAPTRRAIQEYAHPMYWQNLKVVTAKYVDEAGIIGSGAYARNRLLNGVV